MDTSSLGVEDIKIKKEQERANCYGFDVRLLILKLIFFHCSASFWNLHLIISCGQDDSDSD